MNAITEVLKLLTLMLIAGVLIYTGIRNEERHTEQINNVNELNKSIHTLIQIDSTKLRMEKQLFLQRLYETNSK